MSFREIGERAEAYVIGLLEGHDRKSNRDRLARAFLFLASRIYRSVVQLRLSLYSERIFRQHIPGCLVVSIGNLTVGGTGKTPVVEVFAKTLAQKGRKVAILSRGYRSKSQPFLEKMKQRIFRPEHEPPPRVVSDGRQLLLDSAMAGDEPYMLASNLPQVSVVVDKNRVKGSRYATRHLGCDTLVLDDGFQYLRLKPRLNILLVDSTNPFHNHHLLPRGFLREPVKNLRRADYVFLTKSNGGTQIKHLKRFVRRHNPRAEIIECTHKPKYLENVYTGQRSPLELLRGMRISSISGIAVPESFENFLRELGATISHHERYVDHHRYRQQEIIDFLNASVDSGAEMALTTEKDAVRFPQLLRVDIPVVFLRVEIDILSGRETFNDCITRICFL
jgi:tetraacyldisaccharide 4'-kinase